MTAPRNRVKAAGDYLRLKAATRRLVDEAGGQESAASITRISSHATVGRYCRTQDTEFAPIDVIADWEADTGNPLVTRALADLAGLIVIPKPSVEGDPVWVARLGALAKEAGEAIARVGEALGDGTITAEESKRLSLREQMSDVLRVAAEMEAALKAMEDGKA